MDDAAGIHFLERGHARYIDEMSGRGTMRKGPYDPF